MLQRVGNIPKSTCAIDTLHCQKMRSHGASQAAKLKQLQLSNKTLPSIGTRTLQPVKKHKFKIQGLN
jgi:hypothetical protein